jgi:hypothetical protein
MCPYAIIAITSSIMFTPEHQFNQELFDEGMLELEDTSQDSNILIISIVAIVATLIFNILNFRNKYVFKYKDDQKLSYFP